MIEVNISTNTPTISGNIGSSAPEISGNLDTDGIDVTNLRVRVTNLENKSVGSVDIEYNTTNSILTLTTKNTKEESIGTPKTIELPVGINDITYNEQDKNIVVSLSNGTLKIISLQESFDKIDRYIANLQSQINEIDLKKLDKLAYLSQSDIDDYFNN